MKKKREIKFSKISALIIITLLLIPTLSEILLDISNKANHNQNLQPKLNAPTISINKPTPNQLCNSTTPLYNVRITDPFGVTKMWYTIDGGLTNNTFISNGTIDETEWDGRANGTVTITFYANNTLGDVSLPESVTVRKDINVPSIAINSPTTNELFGTTAPDFDVTITDPSGVHTTWYTIDGGANNYTFVGATGTIDQTAWEGRGNGTVTIRYYANDTAGNINWAEVTVRKDVNVPSITINSPTANELFGITAPNFDVTITDPSGIHTTWYTIDGGANNYTFVGATGIIDQTAWEGRGNGTVTIRFYANDTAGNINWAEVTVRKDVNVPSITINSPTTNELFGTTAPDFDVTITDPSGLHTTWYTIDGGANNYTFVGATGTIDQTAWEGQGNGTVTIRFYANDTAGNINWAEVTVRKDIDIPPITINSPTTNELFGTTAPDFDVTITDPSGVHTTWYTIDGGANNYTFVGATGTIDQTAWDGRGNGTVTIRFYANDTAGNINWAEVTVRKDINDPFITINSPTANELFGTTAPNFDVTITDPSGVHTTWYTIDGGANNYTFVGATGTIDQTAWDGRGNGTVTIRFYANDTAGNINWAEVTVRRDVNAPSITINSPVPNQLFGLSAPNFDVTIIDGNLDIKWYELNNGTDWSGNYTFIGSIGTINQAAWDFFANGTVTIRFYANDTLGNIDWAEVTVRRNIYVPSITINSPTPNQVFGSTAPSFNVYIQNADDTYWYTIDGGLTTFTFVTNTSINQAAWDGQGNGTVTIRFYANDTSGNIGWSEVTVRKDINDPSITINSPTANELFGTTAPDFDVTITDPSGVDMMWYTIDGGANNYTFVGAICTIDQIAWNGQGNGTVTIRFYANDTVGNIGWSEVTVRKDISSPSITINSPTTNELFGTTAPDFDVTITDPSGVHTTWYTIDGGANNYTFVGATGTIDQTAWDGQGNGTITIRFYANDTFGNLGYEEVIVQKDMLAPIITINSPTPNQLFIHDVPTFDLTIVEGNLDILWYTMDGGLTNYTFTGVSGTIDQAAWNLLPNGTVTIRFYANDTFGNLGYSQVIIQYNKYAPRPFTLSSTADSPDIDGLFSLNWNISIGADNYSIYRYNRPITEINSSITLVVEGLTNLSFPISVESGTFYFIVVSYNETGYTPSNYITVVVQIPTEKEGFDIIDFLTDPIVLTSIGIVAAIFIVVIIVVKKKKFYKSKDKEVKRIQDIVS